MRNEKRWLYRALLLLGLFLLWTVLVQTVDVRRAGETGTEIGFAAMNSWFFRLTGVHMVLYTVTDWLGLVPVLVCLLFGILGLLQLIQRGHLRKVDPDIILLGIYYVLVIGCYLAFEMLPVNYRPVWIEGRLEASYPSSTTLLVLSVMPTLLFQAECRVRNAGVNRLVRILTILFSGFVVMGRLISGVHWLSDIVGSVLLSSGMFFLYKAAVLRIGNQE